MNSSSRVCCRAYSKVNLALDVVGKRPDGYHEISTVMVPVQVFDLISIAVEDFRVFPGSKGLPDIQVSCPALPDLPPERNLAHRAAAALAAKVGFGGAISIHVDKRVPAGAGMGGGSSDAAAVLVCLNSLLPNEQALDTQALTSLAAGLGADVPFFIGCDSRPPIWEGALCSGIGERVSPVSVPPMWIVLAFPMSSVDTRAAYARWDEMDSHEHPTSTTTEHEDPRMIAFMTALGSGRPDTIGQSLFNDLERATAEAYPVISQIKDCMLCCGALGASMTGSGSAVFGIASSEEHARKLAERIGRAVSSLSVREIIVTRTGVDRDAN